MPKSCFASAGSAVGKSKSKSLHFGYRAALQLSVYLVFWMHG